MVWNNLYAPDRDARILVVALITIAVTLLVELLLAIPLIFMLGIRQSHRVIGPMNRLKRALQAIGQGDFSQRVQLRQGDALEDLARSINKMVEQLQKRAG
ncbi:MAG: HAMP domain-containing protein [Candidatus Omnitrophica bacterium]|nr:HAMP domain-containing protein [Candidatus Omnitrophota bacterium]